MNDIFIVDNGQILSTEDQFKLLRRKYGRVKLYVDGRNIYIAEGNNKYYLDDNCNVINKKGIIVIMNPAAATYVVYDSFTHIDDPHMSINSNDPKHSRGTLPEILKKPIDENSEFCDISICPYRKTFICTVYHPMKYGRRSMRICVFCDNALIWAKSQLLKGAPQKIYDVQINDGIKFEVPFYYSGSHVQKKLNDKIYYIFTYIC